MRVKSAGLGVTPNLACAPCVEVADQVRIKVGDESLAEERDKIRVYRIDIVSSALMPHSRIRRWRKMQDFLG